MTPAPLVRTEAVAKHFAYRDPGASSSGLLKAVDGVDLEVLTGETLGIVGESGCGKSTLCRLLIHLIPPTSGRVLFDGQDLATLKGDSMKRVRRDMQFVFQDPYSSLDPRMSVGRIVAEGPSIHGIGTRRERESMVAAMLGEVGLPASAAARFPHEFSGGQRQRIGIARALIMRPRLVIADEPVSALDVSVQAQILNLLRDLKAEFQLTLVFVTHNMAAVAYIADRVAVMYLGKIVELAPARDLFDSPRHPYTQALLSSIPEIGPTADRPNAQIRGELTSAFDIPSGCRFRTRCPIAQEICAQVEPPLEPNRTDDHLVACHFPDAALAVGSGQRALPMAGESSPAPGA